MSEIKTKKRDVIRQKNKLKVFSDFRFLRYARYMSVLVPCLVVFMIALSTGMQVESLETIISQQPVITVSFVVCVVNLLIWYQSGILLKSLAVPEHVESIRMQYIFMAVAQLAMFNYVSFLMIVFSLWKYFRWDQFSVKQVIAEIKKEGQFANTMVVFIVLFLLSALGLFLLSVFQGIWGCDN